MAPKNASKSISPTKLNETIFKRLTSFKKGQEEDAVDFFQQFIALLDKELITSAVNAEVDGQAASGQGSRNPAGIFTNMSIFSAAKMYEKTCSTVRCTIIEDLFENCIISTIICKRCLSFSLSGKILQFAIAN